MSRYWLVKTKWTDPMKEDSYDRIELTEEELNAPFQHCETCLEENERQKTMIDLKTKIRKVLNNE